jgi:transposase
MSQKPDTSPAVIGIDIGKNSFHIVGQNQHGAIVLRQKWSRGQVEARFANVPPCLIGMEACVGAHHLSRKLRALGHDARLMPAKYVRPYSKGHAVLGRRRVRISPDIEPFVGGQQPSLRSNNLARN